MRRNLAFFLILTVVLAACGGNATPVPTAVPVQTNPTAAPTVNATPTSAPATPHEYATGTPGTDAIPVPGTLATDAQPNPDAGKIFDDLTFTRTGGITGQAINITLTGAGVLTRDGKTSQVSSDQVKQISDALDKLDFFGLDGVFTAPGTSADAYHYSLTVDRNGNSRTINAEDGFIPTPMVQVFGLISALGS